MKGGSLLLNKEAIFNLLGFTRLGKSRKMLSGITLTHDTLASSSSMATTQTQGKGETGKI